MIFAGSAVRVGKVPALVAQRVYAPLLIDVQAAGVVHRQRVLGGHVRISLVERPVARLVYRPKRREVYVQVRNDRVVEYRTVDAVQRPQRDVAVFCYAVAAGHEYASGRVVVRPDLDGHLELFAVRFVTIRPVVRHHPLACARVHRVAQFQEYVHGGRRDLVTVPVAGKRPFYRVATVRGRWAEKNNFGNFHGVVIFGFREGFSGNQVSDKFWFFILPPVVAVKVTVELQVVSIAVHRRAAHVVVTLIEFRHVRTVP